jgi:thymidylate synthase
MNEVKSGSLGETWLKLVNLTLHSGTRLANEGVEVLGVQVGFPAHSESDPIVQKFGDRQMLAEMEKVFFEQTPNSLGHSYANLMHGPDGRQDLADVIDLLRAEPASKRAVVTFCGKGGGKVPCINAIQFLVREGAVHAIYFARGQDAFRKFYADAHCLAKMTRTVARGLALPPGNIQGFIGSSHLYDADRLAIDSLLMQAKPFLSNGTPKGVH